MTLSQENQDNMNGQTKIPHSDILMNLLPALGDLIKINMSP